jgi:hypothetical protein
MTLFPKSTLRCIPGQIRQNKNVQKLRNQIVSACGVSHEN